jgi:hypothetical protein
LSLAQRWLSTCLTSHKCGNGSTTAAKPPTRLVDLKYIDSNNLCLYITDETYGPLDSYLALSYCWGRSNAFATTSATLKSRKEGFRLSDLPLTLQDAVSVTREMGYRYLWVDALCILQGSDPAAQEDWKRESASMDNVYHNAVFTISATGSSDCDGGLFHPRHCFLP